MTAAQLEAAGCVQVIVGGEGFAAVRQPARWVSAFTNFVASPADLD
jgi:hypothetical protein